MEFIEGTRSLFRDAYLSLPLLLIGVLFFLGLLTSNIGMIYLFLGHIFAVPSLSYLFNESKLLGSTQNKLKFGFGSILIGSLLGVGFSSPSSKSWAWTLSSILVALASFGYSFIPHSTTGNASCAIFPSLQDDSVQYNRPTSWVSHIIFFFSFVMSNAIALYNEPTPELSGGVTDEQREQRKQKLEQRVANRKSITVGVIIASSIALAILLFLRYKYTECEDSLLYSLLPMIVVGLTGSAWFSLIYKYCGVRPADILGIVQGLISPDLIDNPIVCMGDLPK